MKLFEFYEKYNSLPIEDRDKYVDKIWHGILTPHIIHDRLRRIERDSRPLEEEREDLLSVANKYFGEQPKPRIDYRKY